MAAEKTRSLVFTMRPNRAMHRRVDEEELPTAGRGKPEKKARNIDTAKIRVHLASNSNPDGKGTFEVQRHEAQKKGLQTGPVGAAGVASFHTAVALTNTTKTDTINLDRWDVLPLTERYGCYDIKAVDTGGKKELLPYIISYGGKRLFQRQIYLFNVIVALEWKPSRRNIQQLIAAFQKASDFLYDATDGYMAFGQVVFGGLELMPGADIQILASNRLHPRSWVNALNEPAKFMPIRLGRGVWQKNNNVSIPWNEPEGYRAIIHEWGHYALGLLDEYLQQSRRQDKQAVAGRPNLVIPKLSIASESIMAKLEGTSEIVPQQRRQDATVQNQLKQNLKVYYPTVDFTEPVNEGPYSLPIELPVFSTTNNGFGMDKQAEELLIDVDDISLDHCWVYVLQWVKGDLHRVIAQGSLDARSRRDPETKFPELGGDGFWLYGIGEDDTLLFIGNDRSAKKQLKVEHRRLVAPDASGKKWTTELITDNATPASIPVVTVMPEPFKNNLAGDENTPLLTAIKVRIIGEQQPDQVWVCPLGQEQALGPFVPTKGTVWISDPRAVVHLDGQILLRWNADGEKDIQQYMVYDYSQGGGPNSHVLAPDPPITAGSSDCNVMFFFRSDVPKSDTKIHRDYSRIRIVTTRNYSGFERNEASKIQPRSYLFSAAWNQPIPADINPTLVMNFDREALEADDKNRDGDLKIGWYHEKSTQWIDTDSYTPKGAFFAALEVKQDAKGDKPAFDPGLPEDNIAHYRLFLVLKPTTTVTGSQSAE
jgi:hypothetical protein